MSFLRAARAALADQNDVRRISHRILATLAALLAGFLPSCGGSSHPSSTPSHNAYVSLPAKGSVALLHIDGTTGALSLAAQTPQVQGTSPKGLALLPSKKFLYAVNSFAATISIFSVASDGTLTLSATPIPEGGSAPDAAVIDPSGKYLLVTNNISNDVSVFSIDSGTGALSQVAGSPFYANNDPSEILITPSGKFVYVTNPGTGTVTGFSFSNGVLVTVPNTPTSSGAGATGLAVDSSGRFLYVANASAPNALVSTIGNISAFNIDPNTGALTSVLGSPFTVSQGNGPTAIAVDPGGRFVYAITSGSSFSIWGFAITATNGQLTPLTNSPFSLTAGGTFALIDPSGNRLYTGAASSNGVAGFNYDSSSGAPTTISGSPFSTGTQPGKMVLSE
jgi:6-phosphogluconolactonase (cycloisomerase 2 family)